MSSLGTATLYLDTDGGKLDRGLDKAEGKAQGAVGGFSKSTLAIGAAFAGVGLAAKNAWDELANAQKVGAQTDAVLRSTAGVAGVTKKDVEDLSGAISDYSGLDDELVQSGANMLLTFTKVRNGVGKNNQIFDRATRAIADVSVGLGKDLPGSAILVGKALNDPVKGMTALGRAGVQFTDEQKKTIQSLVDTGNVAGAQRLILKELETQFGGSAKAAGSTLPGQLSKAKNAFDNLSADLLATMLPVLLSLAQFLQRVFTWMQNNSTIVKVVAAALGSMAAVIVTVIGVVKAWAIAQAILNAVMLANPFVLIVALLAGLVAAVIVAYKESETFRNIVQGVWNAVKSATSTAVNFIVGLFNTLRGAINAVIGWVRSNWPAIATIISGPFAPLVALATDAFGVRSAIVGAFRAILTSVREKLNDIISAITGLWGQARTAADTLGTNIWNGILSGIAAVSRLGAELWSKVSGAISSAATSARNGAAAIGRAIVDGVVSGLSGLFSAVRDKLQSALSSAFGGIDIPGFSPVDHAAAEAIGHPIVEGAVDGLDGMDASVSQQLGRQLRRAFRNPPVPSFAPQTALASGAGGGAPGGLHLHFHGPVIGSGNERELARQLAKIVQPELSRRVALGVAG